MALDGKRWLSDIVVDTFLHVAALNLAAQRQAGSNLLRPPVVVFDSFFMRCLSEGRHDDAWKARRMKEYLATTTPPLPKADVFAGDIVIPMHVDGNHWILVFVQRRSSGSGPRKVYVLDPLQNRAPRRSVMNRVVAWLKEELPGEAVDQAFGVPWLPAQTDGFNCGVYVCMYAYFYMDRGVFPTAADFKVADCAAFRMFMVHTLKTAASVGGLRATFPRRRTHRRVPFRLPCYAYRRPAPVQHGSPIATVPRAGGRCVCATSDSVAVPGSGGLHCTCATHRGNSNRESDAELS